MQYWWIWIAAAVVLYLGIRLTLRHIFPPDSR